MAPVKLNATSIWLFTNHG